MNDKLTDIFNEIRAYYESTLGNRALHSANAWRSKKEEPDIMRSQFAVDRDRILYSGAFLHVS